MKALLTLLSGGVCCLASSTRPEAPVYIFDLWSPWRTEQSSSPKANIKLSSISPSNSRLLFANRLGLSQYHKLDGADDYTMNLFAQFGNQKSTLFQDYDEYPVRTFVIIEGVDDPEIIFPDSRPAFTISNPPPSTSNKQLALDFVKQDRHLRGPSTKNSPEGAAHDAANGGNNLETCLSRSVVPNLSKQKAMSIESSNELLSQLGQTGPLRIYHITALEETQARETVLRSIGNCFSTLRDYLNEITVVLMPTSSKNQKGQASSYGTYTVPKNVLLAREQPEEPLSAAVDASESSPTSIPQPSQPQSLNASAFPKTSLPICHHNNETCISATNDCSGHGACYLKFQIQDADKKPEDCWACRCSVTQLRSNEGDLQKLYWGGSACQKQDVSTPFWLIAGFTIVMVTTISWGIGLMYSIGEEELPSVIGAGVAGPRAQGR